MAWGLESGASVTHHRSSDSDLIRSNSL